MDTAEVIARMSTEEQEALARWLGERLAPGTLFRLQEVGMEWYELTSEAELEAFREERATP